MLNVSQVRLFNLNPQQSKIKNSQVNYASVPNFSPKYSKTLAADTVSFKGGATVNVEKARSLIQQNAKRAGYFQDIGPKVMGDIIAKLNLKNEPYLEKLLTLGKNKLNGKNIIDVLNYIGKEETNLEEVDEKFENFNNLGQIITGFGFKPSVISKHTDKIPGSGIADLLTSDVLLAQPKYNANSLVDTYNYAVKYFERKMNKENITEEKRIGWKAEEFMKNDFTKILLLASVFDKSVCNEILYNRALYVEPLYIPRLKSLNEKDLAILREVQAAGITEKENKGGDLVAYDVSLDDRISMLNFLACNREIINSGYEGIDFNDYVAHVDIENVAGNFKIDFQNLKIDLMDKVLRRIGVESQVVDKYMEKYREAYARNRDMQGSRDKFWDINYVHLLNNDDTEKGQHLHDIVTSATNGSFKRMIYKGDSKYAEINRKNEEIFFKNGINNDKWLEPTIAPISAEFTNKMGNRTKTFTVKNWNRIPQESLLDGNYTTCCTGIDKNHGDSFLHYLTNTCTTTLEVRTERDKVVAMSRLLLAKINGKLSLVVENIEVNNKMAKHYLHNDETKYKFREMIFDYARKFAQDINETGEELPIYFCAQNYKVNDIAKGLGKRQKYEDIELVGVYPNKIYINAYGASYDTTSIRDDGDGFRFILTDITQKTAPVIEDGGVGIESDSNYNRMDTLDFNQK